MLIKTMDNKTDILNNIIVIGENLYTIFTDINNTKTNISIKIPKTQVIIPNFRHVKNFLDSTIALEKDIKSSSLIIVEPSFCISLV